MMLRIGRSSLLLLSIVLFSAAYRVILDLHTGFPPGADIGLHNSVIHSITQGGQTNFMWNYYHMGGGASNTFPGFHIFVSFIIFFTGLPDYLAQSLVAILFSSLLVFVAFLITKKLLNESVALIVAFLVAVSEFDVDMLLWSGYPNIVTLTLIPLVFYLLLEKDRFPRLPLLAAASMFSAAIFLTHSLSAVMFIAITLMLVLVAFCFPSSLGVRRRNVLEWLVPLLAGGIIVLPFLVQVAPTYLNPNSTIYTGGLPSIQKALLSTRIQPLDIVLPFFICFFLCFAFFKCVQGKAIQFSTVLLGLWLIIPTLLTQSFVIGLYTDYQRFFYFADLPLVIVVSLGIFLGAHLLANEASWILSTARSMLKKGVSEIKGLRHGDSSRFNQATVTIFTLIVIMIAFLAFPDFFVTPPEGFKNQGFYQVMNKPGYDSLLWIQEHTPEYSVFVADALYGWWLGGAQRPTVSGVEPQFLTNPREFEPALLASRLLDTDYLIDNGLIQVREDGGYISRHNPQVLTKMNNSYFPIPFLNFTDNKKTISLLKDGTPVTLKVSDMPVTEMRLVNSSAQSASIYVSWGNDLLNYSEECTVYQGISFLNMTEKLSTKCPDVSFETLSLEAETRSYLVQDNNTSIDLLDPYVPLGCQLIFSAKQPDVSLADTTLALVCPLNNQSEATVNFYVGTFEYPYYGENDKTYTTRQEIFAHNLQTYSAKVSNLPLDIFDYRQAINDLNASYIAIRDYSQVSRFAKDPMFSLSYINDEVAIFQVHKSDAPPA